MRSAKQAPSRLAAAARPLPFLLVTLLALLAALALAPSALAANPLRFESKPEEELVVRSTRARVVMQVIDEESLPLEWHAEIAAAEAGHEPPANSPAWKPAGGSFGIITEGLGGGLLNVALGHEAHTQQEVGAVHRLTPETTYFARFLAKDEAGEEASQSIGFTTKPIAKPELVIAGGGVSNQFYEPLPAFVPDVAAFSTSPTSAVFLSKRVQVETNGAPTHYEIAYSTSESGPWTAFASGSEGEVSVAGDFAAPGATTTGLSPETEYFARLLANNEKGEASVMTAFQTPPLKPVVLAAGVRNITATSAYLTGAGLRPHGLETQWRFEVAPSEAGPWTPVGLAGTVSQAEAEELAEGEEEFRGGGQQEEGRIAGLEPNHTYYVRLFAENSAGEAEFCGRPGGSGSEPVTCEPISTAGPALRQLSSFRTFGAPTATTFAVHTLDGETPRVLGAVNPNSVPTSAEQLISLEGAPSGGTFKLSFKGESTGGSGTATTTEGSKVLTGLSTESGAFTTGEAISGPGIPPGAIIVETNPGRLEIEISAPAIASANSVAISADLPYDASGGVVRHALDALPTVFVEEVNRSPVGAVAVTGRDGGPYTIFFGANSAPEGEGHPNPLARAPQPLIQADASGLTPSGSISVTTTQQGGEGSDTHYHVEYEPSGEAGAPFSHASSTAAVDLGVGKRKPRAENPEAQTEYLGADLSGLTAGETYRYRISATNTSPGDPVVQGAEQTLTAPAPAPLEAPASCPNQALRTGASARLPDCRAYEQLTPLNKEGAQEAFSYGGNINSANGVGGALPAEDGDHLLYGATQVKWGAEPGSGQSPYLFTRGEGGWGLTAVTAQPEAGLYQYAGEVFSPDLTQLGVEAFWKTSPGNQSSAILFKAGPAGGPYVTAASIPHADVEHSGSGWIASSADFSKLVLAAEDRTLVSKKATGTQSGNDLYEYSQGALRQLNVDSAGKTIGTCGAKMARGQEGDSPRRFSSRNAVSADGSRAFFEAVPTGQSCSQPTHLYMRANGGEASAETLDIGAYSFLEADPQGATLLISDPSGQLYRYDTATHAKEAAPAGETLSHRRYYVGVFAPEGGSSGLPAGIESELSGFVIEGHVLETGEERIGPVINIASALFGTHKALYPQAVRYDSATHLLQCLACASGFNPEPRLRSVLGGVGSSAPGSFGSVNGDYAFFDTPAALLPADVDGERAPERNNNQTPPPELTSDDYSPSSDVYEWRRDGLEGCDRIQGCLSLITSGRGGYLNVLLGSAHEGRDVFFATRESLLPRDNDTSSDIYDARIGGGFPEAEARIPCEADSCHNPASAPSEPTLSTSVPSGPGNERPASRRHHKKKRHRHHPRRHRRPANRNRGGAK